jgi:hypothetical protein
MILACRMELLQSTKILAFTQVEQTAPHTEYVTVEKISLTLKEGDTK